MFKEKKNWLISLSLFLILLAEIYSFKFIGLENVENTSMSLMLANKLWLNNNLFSFKAPFLMIFFSGIILYFLMKNGIKNYPKKSINWLFAHAGIFLSYVIFLSILKNSSLSYFVLLSLFYLMFAGLGVSLVIGIFGWDSVRDFFTDNKEKVFLSVIISYVFLNFYSLFQKSWPVFSKIVAYPVYLILSIFYSDAYISYDTILFGRNFYNIPTVGNGDFGGIIFRPCSGIEGLSLFLLLFTVIVIVEWRTLNLRRVALLYPIGFLSMIAFNILRIAFLIMLGIEINPSVAMGGFHSNLGWVVFSIFFFIFLKFTYGWMKR